jgi:hypothetical protein
VAPHILRNGTELDDLEELQVVTKRELRRGYDGQFHGRPMRLAYGKIMDVNGGVLVYRPALGRERPKRMPRVSPSDLLLLAICAWPVTIIALLLVISLATVAIRALLR